jgi:hypothetical protein
MWSTTLLRKSRSWLTTGSSPVALRKSSSHSTASRSRWLEGSSSSSRSGSEKSRAASATRIRQPPEKLSSGGAAPPRRSRGRPGSARARRRAWRRSRSAARGSRRGGRVVAISASSSSARARCRRRAPSRTASRRRSALPARYSRARAARHLGGAARPARAWIVDFGSQVTQLIARRVREAGVYCEIAPFNAAEEAFERMQPKGVIFSGGPASVTWEDSPRAPQACSTAACRCSASATASRPWPAARRQGRHRRPQASSAAPSSRWSDECAPVRRLWQVGERTRCG